MSPNLHLQYSCIKSKTVVDQPKTMSQTEWVCNNQAIQNSDLIRLLSQKVSENVAKLRRRTLFAYMVAFNVLQSLQSGCMHVFALACD